MTDITIPREAEEAANNAYEAAVRRFEHYPLRAACLAMIRSWPGMSVYPGDAHPKFGDRASIILPLPLTQETRDE